MDTVLRALAYVVLLMPSLIVYGASHTLFPGNFVLFWLLMAAEFTIATFIHELGHAAGCRACGLRIETFAVWPFAYRVSKGRFEWWLRFGADFGGFVSFSEKYATSGKVAFVAFAGPAASIAVALLGFALASSAPGHDFPALVGSVAAVSFFMGLGNLIPFRMDGVPSDGSVMLSNLRRKYARGSAARRGRW